MQQDDENYVGQRILEAMHNAVRYSDTIFRIVQGAMPRSSGKVLDFGAGDGLFAQKFRSDGMAVDCIEPDPDLRSRLETLGLKVFSDIQAVGDASYDFIYTINVLEHISDLDRTCTQLFRTLRPGGKLFVFVPAFELLWTSLDDEVGHVRRFTQSSLREALVRPGFLLERLEYFDSLGFPAALAVRVLEQLKLFHYSSDTVGFYDQYLFPTSRYLDKAFNRVLGKNVIACASKPGNPGI